MLDSDGQIFGAHDYKHFYGITNAPKDLIDSNSPPSRDYIKQAKIYGVLTPLTRDSINEIFAHNPQVFLVYVIDENYELEITYQGDLIDTLDTEEIGNMLYDFIITE